MNKSIHVTGTNNGKYIKLKYSEIHANICISFFKSMFVKVKNVPKIYHSFHQFIHIQT